MRRWTAAWTVVSALALLALPARAQPAGGVRRGFGPPAFPLLRAIDGDGDGEISAAEIEKAAAALKGLDRNGDGKLARDEYAPRPGRFGGPGRRAGPGGRQAAPGRGAASAEEGTPLPKTSAEKKILDVLDDMDRNQRRGMMNVPKEDGRLLRLLAEAVGAKRVVEIGTSNGYSGIWFCLALRKTGGRLTTHEIDARRASLARENFQRAGVADLVTLVEGDAHEEVKRLKGPIDILFLDADKPGYPDYLEKLRPLVRPGGLILAHNMRRPSPNPDYVKAVTADPKLETLFLHMEGAGIGVTLKKR